MYAHAENCPSVCVRSRIAKSPRSRPALAPFLHARESSINVDEYTLTDELADIGREILELYPMGNSVKLHIIFKTQPIFFTVVLLTLDELLFFLMETVREHNLLLAIVFKRHAKLGIVAVKLQTAQPSGTRFFKTQHQKHAQIFDACTLHCL